MRLFHYTGRDHIAGIMQRGILPYVALAPEGRQAPQQDVIWLTESRDWSQTWATMHSHTCDRTAVRLTVQLADAYVSAQLRRYIEVRERFGEWAKLLEAPEYARDVPHWWIFTGGRIDPSRIKRTEYRGSRDVPG